MSEHDFGSHQPDHPDGLESGSEVGQNGAGGWQFPRWRRGGADRTDEGTGDSPPSPAASPQDSHWEGSISPGKLASGVVTTHGASTHLHGNADVVAAHVENLIMETHQRDVLEGVELDRQEITEQPFIREGHWVEAWEQAIDPATARLRQRVLIVVSPRSFGSTTFALHLLAHHTGSQTRLVKLDADWTAPSRGRLPLKKSHAFQLDLKDGTTDRPSADFLNSLTKYAEDLEARGSYLVLTVAKELWEDHYLATRRGIHAIHLTEPPNAQRLVEAHLHFHGHTQLAPYTRSLEAAKASLRGLDAVEAVRAAGTIVVAWEEHTRHQQAPLPLSVPESASHDATVGFEERLAAALSDWREKLDRLFGEATAVHEGQNPSLTLEDRCLLLALAVRQSAPMPKVASAARSLQDAVTTTSQGKALVSPVQTVFAGRGLRRRILDVGATVDSHDTVIFDQPAYGRAILAYVWDNYEVMREPLLAWLLQTGDRAEAADPAVSALSTLTLRHGTADYLNVLGSIARGDKSDLLSAVMVRAVKDEHVGRLAWATLYRWAEQQEYGASVISTCRRVLHDPSASPSTAKMAMVRLRRVAHTTGDRTTRQQVLEAFHELAQQPSGTDRLVTEVRDWQQSKAPSKSGSLALLALMSVSYDNMPWLMSDAAPDIDVDRALQDLLSDTATAEEVTPRLTEWIRTCATSPATYVRLRDRLIPALRGHNMFQAGMGLMRALADVPTIQGVNVAEDFYRHLVDPRLHKVFALEGDPA